MNDHGRPLPLASHLEPSADATPLATAPDGVTRRTALQGLAVGLGLAIGTPAEGHDHPLAAHVAQRQRPRTTPPRAAAPTPQFFDAHQFATLTLVSELIVPGSVASGSPAWIDEVLAIEHDEVQRPVVSALAAVDAAAREQHGQTFRALTAAQRPVLLEGLDAPLALLKSWVSGAHYSSEAGMKELGFSGSVFFQAFPACTHPDGHE